MKVFQICSIDQCMWEDGHDDLIDMLSSGNVLCSTLAKAKALCQADEDEDLADESKPLAWTKVKKTWTAESATGETTYIIIETKVQ